MSSKKVNLVHYFLRSSPVSRYRNFTKVFSAGDYSKQPPPFLKSDEDYVYQFLDSLEVFGPSNANFSIIKSNSPHVSPQFRKIFPSLLVPKKPTPGACQEHQQLTESIKLVTAQSGDGTIPFQELEQRLEIASPEILAEVRTKLIYLFKLLINKRDKIHPNSLELDANLQLSRAIIAALSRIPSGEQSQQNWKQLEAMQKLLRAREYHKKGLKQIALNNFQQICRDEAASSKTRMQALKVLCSSGEELGDPTVLESLISEMQAKGEKQYQEIILTSIKRIKGMKQQ